jgi:hypothetical protein
LEKEVAYLVGVDNSDTRDILIKVVLGQVGVGRDLPNVAKMFFGLLGPNLAVEVGGITSIGSALSANKLETAPCQKLV